MERKPKIRIMEPSKIGEVRRVHVIYFLCRNGVVEQPHLIRVHHLHRSGVHLRDVKRWLSELRGKDMPDAYAWSYKRRYKSGHVWQDLTDDDLITPISDNEYVLKGSEVPNVNNPLFETYSSGRRTPDCLTHIARAAAAVEEEENPKIDVPSLISSPETLQDDNSSPMPPPHELSEATTPVPSITAPSTTGSPLQRPVPPARQPYSNTRSCFNYSGSTKKASKMLRNLIRCRADDVVHSAVFPTVGRKERGRLTDGDSTGQVSSRMTFDAGSIQPSLTPSSSSRTSRSGSVNGSTIMKTKAAAKLFKPVGETKCSQCKKTFKPHKFQSHMRSCKALRGLRKE